MKSLIPLFLVLAACGTPEQPVATPAPAPAPAPEAVAADAEPAAAEGGSHCVTGAEPGSHEDWCAGHGVPESQCTRCNADLIPAFKAVGDWCDEHGLPMSQCTACNPDLVIERPPKES